MKYFILTIFLSLNIAMASEIGENIKPDCSLANQSPKRDAKEVAPAEQPSTEKPVTTTISV